MPTGSSAAAGPPSGAAMGGSGGGDEGESKHLGADLDVTWREDPLWVAREPPADEEHAADFARAVASFSEADRELGEAVGMALSDALINRYLRATDYDVPKAVAALRATLEWRKEFGVARLRPSDIAAELNGKLVVRGHDAFGRPVIVMRPRLENTWDHTGNLRNLVLALELAVRRMPPGVEKWCVIVDYGGYSLRNAPSMATTRATLNIFQSHFVERLGVALLINAPWLFNGVWSVLSPFMDEKTRQKVVFVKGDASDGTMRKALAPYFGPDQWGALDTEYGGDAAPTDGGALSFDFDKGAYMAEADKLLSGEG